MLERATTCLDSGARISTQQCTKRAPRSRRLLHSTFWNHGAGDLDLAAFALSTSVSRDLPLRHSDPQSHAARDGNPSSQPKERSNDQTPFLDFLYPPQVLTTLHQMASKGVRKSISATAGGSQWERWKRRNSRRLPDGFVQAARGYTSRAHTRPSAPKTLKDAKELEDVDPISASFDFPAMEGGKDAESDNLDLVEEDIDAAYFEQMSSIRAELEMLSTPDESSITDSARDTLKSKVQESTTASRTQHTSVDLATALETDAVHPEHVRLSQEDGDMDVGLAALEAAVPDEQTQNMRQELNDDDLSLTEEDWAAPINIATPQEIPSPPRPQAKATHLNKRYRFDIPLRMQEKLKEVQYEQNGKARALCRDLLAEEAWAEFSGLPEQTREDPELKTELLQLFSQFRSVVAAKHYTTLLKSVPRTEWNAGFLKPLMEVNLGQKRFRQVSLFHKAAITHLELDDAVSLSTWLLGELTSQRRWDHAVELLVQAAEGSPHLLEAMYRELPVKLEGMSNMFTISCSLIRYSRRQDESRRVVLSKLCTIVFRAGLGHLVRDGLALNNDPLRMQYIRRLATFLSSHDPSAGDFLHHIASVLVSRGYKAMRDTEIYRLLSFFFRQLKKTDNAKPTQALLLSIQKWVERYSKLHPTGLANSGVLLSLETIVHDWVRYYSRPDLAAIKSLLTYNAYQGDVEQVKRWKEELRQSEADFTDYKMVLRSLVYVHARKGQTADAKLAFQEVREWAAAYNDFPDVSCWNTLIYAHLRADDPQGAIATLVEMVSTADVELDAMSVQPVMELLAKRGDVEGVEELAHQFDNLSPHKRTTAMVASLVNAYVNVGDIETAEKILSEALEDVKEGKVNGSLTISFNILITAHAFKRDLIAATDTYRWMKSEGVPLNEDTFAALMQSLAIFRKTDAAFKILRKVMPESGFKPTAFHYAIIIAGYVNQGILDGSTFAYIRQHMEDNKVNPSINTEVAFRKAETVRQHKRRRSPRLGKHNDAPLTAVITDLQGAIEKASANNIYTQRQPLPGLSVPDNAANALAARYDFLIEIHGSRRCFQAVRQVFDDYQADMRRHGFDEDAIPMRMMTALMSTHFEAGEYSEVERCWHYLKTTADKLTQSVHIPNLPSKTVTVEQFGRALPSIGRRPNPAYHNGGDESSNNPRIAKPVINRRSILSRPLRHLIAARAAQNKLPSVVNTASNLLNQGYTFDNLTWNALIETLCRAHPPLTLLAFVLAERFLMPQWPDWKYHRSPTYPLKRSEIQQGLQHIRGRYLPRTQLLPFYKTLVWMGRALLELRDHDAGMVEWTVEKEVEGFVGSMERVSSRAPMALAAVQGLPRVGDKLQENVLKKERLRTLG